jgi:hypothetical protein
MVEKGHRTSDTPLNQSPGSLKARLPGTLNDNLTIYGNIIMAVMFPPATMSSRLGD